MGLFEIQPNLPPGVTFDYLLGIIVFEFCLLVLLSALSILGLKNYRKKPSKLRILVTLICIGYSVILIILMLPQILRLLGFSSTVDAFFLQVNEVAVLLTTLLFWLFYVEVFVEDPREKRRDDIVFSIIAILIIIMIIPLGPLGTIFYVIASLTLTLFVFIKLMVKSREIARKLKNRLDRARMQFLFITILFLTLSYFMTFTTSALEQLFIVPLYSALYIISAVFGFLPFVTLYVAFFQPPSFKLRYTSEADLPLIKQEHELATFDDDLPRMSNQDLVQGKDSFEWWYFDLKDPQGASVVILFERKDPINHPTHPSLRIEYEKGAQKFQRVQVYPFEDFKYTCDSSTGQNCQISIGPNSLLIKNGPGNIISGYELKVRLPDFELDLSLTSTHQGFKPSPDGCYFIHKLNPQLNTHVVFASPRVQGRGTIVLKGTHEEITGEGYHDHPWGSAQLLMTHGTWHWGRLFTDQVSIMFAQVWPSTAFYGSLKFCFIGTMGQVKPQLLDAFKITPSYWSKIKKLGLKFPHQISLESEDHLFSLQTRSEKILLEVPVYVRSQVSFDYSSNGGSEHGNGTGWVEYFHCPRALKNFFIMMNKRATLKWQT